MGSDSSAVLHVAVLVSDGADAELPSPEEESCWLHVLNETVRVQVEGLGPTEDFNTWMHVLGAC